MIINNIPANIIQIPSNTVYTPQMGSNLYGLLNVSGMLGNTLLYHLPNDTYMFTSPNNTVYLPAIFNTTVLNNLYNQIYQYYVANMTYNTSTYNAAYIDSSGNVYLGYFNNTYVVGMQFLSGSTSINKQGIYYTLSGTYTGNTWGYTGNTTFTLMVDVIFYAQLTNPRITYRLASANSSTTATAYPVLDGVQGSQNAYAGTTGQNYTYQFTVSDNTINRHELRFYLETSSAGSNAYFSVISLM